MERCLQLPGNKEIVLQAMEDVVENFQKKLRPGDKRVKKSVEIMEQKYHLPLKIGEIADEVGLTENALMKLFVKTTGKTMIEYLTEIRLKHAKNLLQKTSDTIEGIAFSCGFNSYEYFSMVFRKYEQISPGKFRRNY
jgi:two-component system response regulator YesN